MGGGAEGCTLGGADEEGEANGGTTGAILSYKAHWELVHFPSTDSTNGKETRGLELLQPRALFRSIGEEAAVLGCDAAACSRVRTDYFVNVDLAVLGWPRYWRLFY